MSNIATFRILRNKIGSLSSHLHSGYPVKQSPGPSPSLPLANSSAAAMAYSGLYQHFPPYTPPISSPPPSGNNNNNNSPASSSLPPTSQTSCSPTKSEPAPELASHNSAVSSACFNKWPGWSSKDLHILSTIDALLYAIKTIPKGTKCSRTRTFIDIKAH